MENYVAEDRARPLHPDAVRDARGSGACRWPSPRPSCRAGARSPAATTAGSRRTSGDFWGYQAGIWSLFSSFLDNALYPVLFAAPGRPLRAVASRGFEQWLARRRLHRGPHVPQLPRHRDRRARRPSALNALPARAPGLAGRGGARPLAAVNPLVPFAAPGLDSAASCRHGPRPRRCGSTRATTRSRTAAEEIENPKRATFPSPSLCVTPLVVAELRAAHGGGARHERRLGELDLGPVRDRRLRAGRAGPRATGSSSAASRATRSSSWPTCVWWSRLVWALADDGYLPARSASCTRASARPTACCSPTASSTRSWPRFPFEDLLVADSWLAGAYTMLIHFAVVRARRSEPERGEGFRIPGGRVGLWLNVLVPAVTWIALLVFTRRDQIWLGARVPAGRARCSTPLTRPCGAAAPMR